MPKTELGGKYHKKYTEDDLKKALRAVRDGMPKREASRTFHIPRATLQFRTSDKFVKARHGPSTVLTDEEENVLVDWIKECHQKGFPRRKDDIQLSVKQFLDSQSRKTIFANNKPGDGWYKGFMDRHQDISVRKSEAITTASSKVSEHDIKKWFRDIYSYLEKKDMLNVLNDATRIFNADETNFMICPQTKNVLAPKGSRNVYEVECGASKASITVLFTFSASGSTAPPLIIYPYKRMPKEISNSAPKEFSIACSDTGWMKKEIFYEYIGNTFYNFVKSTNTTFPVILFVDGHKTHLDKKLTELCNSLNIILVALYPNATRILQPADVSTFKPLKDGWRRGVNHWRRTHPTQNLDKKHFASLLKTVIEESIKPQTIANGFKTCGLYPWNPEAIDYTKCLGGTTKKKGEIDDDTILELKFKEFRGLVGEEMLDRLINFNESSAENTEFNILYSLWQRFQETSRRNEIENKQDENVQEIDKNQDTHFENDENDIRISPDEVGQESDYQQTVEVLEPQILECETTKEPSKVNDKTETTVLNIGDIVNMEDINIMNLPTVIIESTGGIPPMNSCAISDINTTFAETSYKNNDLSKNINCSSGTHKSQQTSVLSLANANLSLQDHLYWPATPIRKGKKDVERVPFVLTSSTYKEMQEKKEMEKLNILTQRENKKKERQLKKRRIEEEKLSKKTQRKRRKISNTENKTNSSEEQIQVLREMKEEKFVKNGALIEISNNVSAPRDEKNRVEQVKRNLSFDLTIEKQETVGLLNKSPLKEISVHEFTNILLFEGLCFTCTRNFQQENVGIKCSHCLRTYHVKCIKKYDLHKSNSNIFTCLPCLKKIVV